MRVVRAAATVVAAVAVALPATSASVEHALAGWP